MTTTSIALLLLGLIVVVASQTQNCDKLGIRLYEDMGCQAEGTIESCPSYFKCDLVPPANKCLYQGKAYTNGERFDRNKQGYSCHSGCFCSTTNSRNPVVCPLVGCIDNLPPAINSACYYGYSLEQCCTTGEICPPFNDTTTCIVDGTTFKAGQRFSPKDSCYTCICAKGFDGKYEEPYCKRSGCDVQLRNQLDVKKFCAPVYIKDRLIGDKICCPTTWTCHENTEIVSKNNKESYQKCKYGETEFNIGDSFTKTIQYLLRSKHIICKCEIPPLMQCFD